MLVCHEVGTAFALIWSENQAYVELVFLTRRSVRIFVLFLILLVLLCINLFSKVGCLCVYFYVYNGLSSEVLTRLIKYSR